MHEVDLAEQLLAFDTSDVTGLERAMDFAAGWLNAAGVPVREVRFPDRRCLIATAGDGPARIIFNGHLDVVPGDPAQFSPVRRDGRLYGRGAYDMKGALAAMMLAVADLAAQRLRGAVVELVIVPDEERSEPGLNCSEALARDGLRGDIVICGEPTDFHVGVQAKGVVCLELDVPGVAAHGSTPWLGRNAVLRAIELYEAIGRLPFMTESSELFPSPSLNLGRIEGGEALNSVPGRCRMWIDIRSLPGQSRSDIVAQVAAIDPEVGVTVVVDKAAADVAPTEPMVQALLWAARGADPTAGVVGRDGSSDAIPFLEAGVPAVEFGPVGAGHHGPDEYVEMASLATYRRALVQFVRRVAADAQADGVAWTPEYTI